VNKVNVIVLVVLSLALVYLIYRHSINDEWNRTETILFIIVLAGGLVNSSIVEFRRWKDKKQHRD